MYDPTRIQHPPVTWQFELRPRSPGEEVPLFHANQVRVFEELGRPYIIDLELRTEHEVILEDLLGLDGELSWGRESWARTMLGVVQQAEILGSNRSGLLVGLRLGPALATLAVGRRSRVFQGLGVLEIVQEVVGPLFARTRREIDVSRAGTTEPRDYCVQYRETDLAFVERLLADEGLTYEFVHDGDTEKMVVVGDGASFVAADGDEVPVVRVAAISEGGLEQETIHGFVVRSGLYPRKVRCLHHEWKEGKQPVIVGDAGEQTDPELQTVLYDDFAHPDEDAPGAGLDLTVGRAGLELDRATIQANYAHGKSTVCGLQVGQLFELYGHADPVLDARYRVTVLRHHFASGDDPESGSTEHENHFACISSERTYRPARRVPRPRIAGVHTATVTGPENEEIHVDKHGRIRCRMHWDERGAESGDGSEPSCWVRVGQAMAGPGFGMQILPRVGMEVIIAFIDGNPDRPLCVGCVYNGANEMPYDPSAHKTRSTLKTKSSPGDADEFNELRFEDAGGHEQIYLHAQRNLDETVRSCRTSSVGVDERWTVGQDRETTIERDETHHVKGNRTRDVQGDESVLVVGNQRTDVGTPGDCSIGAPSGPGSSLFVHGYRDVVAKDQIKLVCGDSSIVMTPDKITIASPHITLNGGGSTCDIYAKNTEIVSEHVEVKAEMSELLMDQSVTVQSNKEVKLSVFSSCLTLDGNAELVAPMSTVTGEMVLKLDSPTGPATMEGMMVTVAGTTITTIQGGGATATFAAGMASICE